MNYQTLAFALGKNVSTPWGNNRRIVRITDTAIAYVLHNTSVATFDHNGDIILDNGGYFSATSKKAINEALVGTGYRVTQKNGEWSVSGVRFERFMSIKGA